MQDHDNVSKRQELEAEQPNRSQSKRTGRPKSRPSKRPVWLRIMLRSLRVLIVPIACVVVLYVGLYIGYVKLGDQSAEDVWKPETWKHVFDLVFAEK